jgi:hypothetical protein
MVRALRSVLGGFTLSLPPTYSTAWTRCGGQGVTIFYGMAKQVRAPQIGPARRPENCALSRVNVRFGSLAEIQER